METQEKLFFLFYFALALMEKISKHMREVFLFCVLFCSAFVYHFQIKKCNRYSVLLLVVVVGKQKLSFVIEIKLSWWMFANKFYYLKLSRKWFPKAFKFFVLYRL